MPELTSNQQRLFMWLKELVAIGEPCPTDTAITRKLGFAAESVGHRALFALRDAGLIEIESGQRWRVVTIVATGKSTKRPDGAPAATARVEAAIPAEPDSAGRAIERAAAPAPAPAPAPTPPRPSPPPPAPKEPFMPATVATTQPADKLPPALTVKMARADDEIHLIILLGGRQFLTVPLDHGQAIDLIAGAANALLVASAA